MIARVSELIELLQSQDPDNLILVNYQGFDLVIEEVTDSLYTYTLIKVNIPKPVPFPSKDELHEIVHDVAEATDA